MTKNTRELKDLLLQFIAYGHEPITVTFSGELGDDTKVFQMPFNTMLIAIEKWNDALITQTKQETIQACIDALPEKTIWCKEFGMSSSRCNKCYHCKVSGNYDWDEGYEYAIDTAHTALNELKED